MAAAKWPALAPSSPGLPSVRRDKRQGRTRKGEGCPTRQTRPEAPRPDSGPFDRKVDTSPHTLLNSRHLLTTCGLTPPARGAAWTAFEVYAFPR